MAESELLGFLKIDPVTYTIEREDLAPATVGRASFLHGKVQLATGLRGPQAEATLWHEIIHLFLIQSGLELGKQEENVCDTIAMGMVRLMRDNPSIRDLFAAVR